MFTRVVEFNCKPGKSEELTDTLHGKVVYVLNQQPGFVDESILVSDTNPDYVMSISYWNSKEDAERYRHGASPKIREMVQPLLESDPVIRTFEVHTL